LNTPIVFEFPLNERIRVFLRLEQLLSQINHFVHGDTVWDSRAAISSLLDILAIFERHELKAEILKELERHSGVLTRISQSHGVDQEVVMQIQENLDQIKTQLYAASGKIGLDLMGSELFKCISRRNSIPGGTCAFDLPEYHYWLQQDDSRRQSDLEQWLEPFKTIHMSIGLILRYIRESSTPTSELAEAGFFQQSLDRSRPFQMLRVTVPRSFPYFAEISGGKHRFTIRFMTPHTSERPTQTHDDIEFQLTRCLF
jgi:cell division protein ZapD